MRLNKQSVFVAMLLAGASGTAIAGQAIAGGAATPAPVGGAMAPANPGMTTPAAPMGGGAVLGQNHATPAPTGNPNIEQKPGDGGVAAGDAAGAGMNAGGNLKAGAGVNTPTGNPNAETRTAQTTEPVQGRIQFIDPDGKKLQLDNGKTYALGTTLDVKGVGVMLRGDSGVGKSELGLELISRGHGLVADDVVELETKVDDIDEGQNHTEVYEQP